MARDPDMERRLLNWARWKAGESSGGLGYGSGSMWNSEPTRSGYREAIIPTNDCEAVETDAAIQALPEHLRDTIGEHYCGAHADIPSQAVKLGCAVSTVHARLADAHRRLAIHFRDRADAAQVERERVAALAGHPIARKREFYEL